MTKDERYCNAKVYKLIDTINGYYYIGSTCMPLSKRLSGHKSDAKRKTDQKIYKYFNYIGWYNVKIILHSEHYLDNKEQLLREEDNVIQIYLHDDKCLNSRRALTTEEYKKEYQKEYYETNKEQIRESQKEYNENNKEKIKEYNKEYYETNKEQIQENQKEYNENNKEKIKEYNKEYYGKMKQEIKCVCGSSIQKKTIKTHEKTKKHINYINNLIQCADTI
jgi:hypothetical protein